MAAAYGDCRPLRFVGELPGDDTNVDAARLEARATCSLLLELERSLLAAEDELVAVQILEDGGGAPGFYFGRGDEFDASGF
jgi:hypothetical protein